MTSFQDFLHQRLLGGGFTTEDALASFLPLAHQAAECHRAGLVAPLAGCNDLHVEGVRIWFEDVRRQPPTLQIDRLRALGKPVSRAVEVVGEFAMTTDADEGEEKLVSLQVGPRGEEICRPVYLPGYVSWEHEIGHHDPLSDIFSLGMILASLTCGLDFNEPEELEQFVRHRRNLFHLNAQLHPVLAKAIVRMTELDRHRRPQDLAALIRTLENYRDQDIDFDFELARAKEWRGADPRGKREVILARLQQRLFEISRRNRLLHFRPTMHTVNLTLASVPLAFDYQNIRPEQILTCNSALQQALASGRPIALNKYLCFDEAIYLPSLLDGIRNEARRDQTEYGFASLRLVLCFLRWSNLKEKPPERFESPLVLLPVQLARVKGVRDIYSLEPTASEAEINPVLRHYFKQLHAVELPEKIELTTEALDRLHEYLVATIQSSEPAVVIEKIDRPRIQLIQARAQRRLDQYRRRARLSGRGVRTFLDIDYSYDRDNYQPLGLRLFQLRLKPTEPRLRTIAGHEHAGGREEKPGRLASSKPVEQTRTPAQQKDRTLYAIAEDDANPYRWEFDLCNVTLGNFRYQKMTLVRDYAALLQNERGHGGFDGIFSLSPRPAEPVRTGPPSLEESYPILPWDPTQSSAIGLARLGKDFIIQGPPGTGKSQTITNLIADYVARGKRVLFVCEKRAAIDVVYHRLKQVGLHQLCCLIHDSQADKKEFVFDLKATYGEFLEGQGKRDRADKERQQLLASLKQDLAPLQHFHEAMRSIPPQARVPLRGLLCRAVELGDHLPGLSPRDRERIPTYAMWDEQRDRLGKLSTLLGDTRRAGGVGPLVTGSAIPPTTDLLSSHPLRHLNTRLSAVARPLEVIGESLQSIRPLLDALQPQLQTMGLKPTDSHFLDRAAQAVSYALSVQYLAERKQIALLQPDSELSKKLAALQKSLLSKAKEVEKARAATRYWKHKLSADDVKIALEQARSLGTGLGRFFQPAYWRLRALLNRSYNFRAHQVRPTWVQVLQGLQREHQLCTVLAHAEASGREQFGYTGELAQFAEKVSATRKALSQLPESILALHRAELKAADGNQQVLQLAGLRSQLQELDAKLAEVLQDHRSFSFDRLREELARMEGALDQLPDFMPCLAELGKLPGPLAEACRWWPMSLDRLEAAMARRTLDEVFRADRLLARHTAETHRSHVERLDQVQERLHAANADVVRESARRRFLEHVHLAGLPHAQLDAEQKEFKTCYNRGRRELEHEFGKTMRFKSIRDLVAGDSGLVLQDLKPVWLMSPLSVADALPLDTNPFDVVIFDEASQVTLEEAVPCIFRARQVIVVGDPMQLPPTSFFSARQLDDEETLILQDEEGQSAEYDLGSNSFLTHAARNLPTTMLGWHYRSRSESLISFSNAAFYQGRLLSVPEVALPGACGTAEIRARTAAEGKENVARLLDRPVSFHFVEGAVYAHRRNAAEADYIAHLVRGLLEQEKCPSIGVVAFSEAQQGEIEEALERLARDDPDFRDRLEAEYEREQDGQFIGLLVKNLENIQGDERDVVILSVCYGHNPNGKMLMNFGPINQNGGERRLNVAFSRARQHMVLVSSIRHHHITNDYNDGARCLKNYLRYAEALSKGDFTTARRVLGEMTPREEYGPRDTATDVVIAGLAAALRGRGYGVDTTVGQSSFRCDLAIYRDGDRSYRQAILVDTDDYYGNSNILERDVLRPRLLRSFGWKVAHVLTKDWYENRQAVLEGLLKEPRNQEH